MRMGTILSEKLTQSNLGEFDTMRAAERKPGLEMGGIFDGDLPHCQADWYWSSLTWERVQVRPVIVSVGWKKMLMVGTSSKRTHPLDLPLSQEVMTSPWSPATMAR